jgi:hypothetical protein
MMTSDFEERRSKRINQFAWDESDRRRTGKNAWRGSIVKDNAFQSHDTLAVQIIESIASVCKACHHPLTKVGKGRFFDPYRRPEKVYRGPFSHSPFAESAPSATGEPSSADRWAQLLASSAI